VEETGWEGLYDVDSVPTTWAAAIPLGVSVEFALALRDNTFCRLKFIAESYAD
jgi:hypothetical protein